MTRVCLQLLFFFAACSLLPTLMWPQAQGGRGPEAQREWNERQTENALELTPLECGLYRSATTLIDWTPRQIKGCPALHKLRPTADQGQLAEILKRAGEAGELAFQDFPRISSDEAITSEIGQGGPSTTEHQKFQYIVIPDLSNGVTGLEEYRTTLGDATATKFSLGNLYMLTSGFASTWLYLSPAEQRDSRFRYFGMQRILNRECQVVGFAQEPARARPAEEVEVAYGRRDGLLVQGLAWIDAETYQTLRIMTWLLAPRMDLGLSAQISTVDFYPIQPIGMDRTLWLPRDVNVWAVYHGVGIRNIHRYSNFKLFRVESTVKP